MKGKKEEPSTWTHLHFSFLSHHGCANSEAKQAAPPGWLQPQQLQRAAAAPAALGPPQRVRAVSPAPL